MRLDDDVDDEMEAASIEVPLTTPPSDAVAAAVRTAHLAVRWTMRLGPTASAARSRDAPRVDMLPGKCERGRAGPDLVDMLEWGTRREPIQPRSNAGVTALRGRRSTVRRAGGFGRRRTCPGRGRCHVGRPR